MNPVENFMKTLEAGAVPTGLSPYLQSLWYDAKGDWQQAHNIIQDQHDKNAAWIHAYLHRKEGDIGNADYWYSNAGKKRPPYPLEREWKEIVEAMLQLQKS